MRSKRYSEFVRIHTYKIAEEILRPVLQKSYRKLNQLIGNSIVVNVLQAIFEAMFGDTYKKSETSE